MKALPGSPGAVGLHPNKSQSRPAATEVRQVLLDGVERRFESRGLTIGRAASQPGNENPIPVKGAEVLLPRANGQRASAYRSAPRSTTVAPPMPTRVDASKRWRTSASSLTLRGPFRERLS
jgi:hypothetical protein